MTCNNPEHKVETRDDHGVVWIPYEIKDGDRSIHVETSVNWGEDDLRAEWSGHYDFCSFGCAEEWLGEKASQHDGRVVREGT